MTYLANADYQGVKLNDTDSTKNFQLGTIVSGFDTTYGNGEFIYLAGVASTAIGDLVIYDNKAGTTTRAVAGSRGPAAIAVVANTSTSTYAWYQIQGSAIVKAATVAANGNVYATATAGTVDDAVVAGDKVDGARFKTADGTPSAGFAVVEISRPSMNANG